MNQDQFPRRKSSLQKLFIKSGSIHPLEIIPPRYFLQIRINLPDENHPSQTFPANQDHFPRRKSSLQKLFIKSGSIFPLGIIPPRHFYQIRITPPPKMHPQPRFQANQDNSLAKSPVPNASPTASKSSRSNFSHPQIISHQLCQQSPASHHSAAHLTPGFFLPRLDQEQCPEASRPSEQCPLCLHSQAFRRV